MTSCRGADRPPTNPPGAPRRCRGQRPAKNRTSLAPRWRPRPRIARFGVFLVALAVIAVGCGNAGVGPGNTQTTTRSGDTSVATDGTGQGGLRTEPSGPETAVPPSGRGLAIALGGPPSGRGGAGASFYRFSDQEPTWCVPIGSGTILELSAIPAGMSIGVTTTVESNPANAFVASDSSRCQTPCDTYKFTTPTWHCDTGVTWNGRRDGSGGLSVTLIAYCGTADVSDCKKWANTNYNPDGLELGAHATEPATTTTGTTSPEPTTGTSTTTSTAGSTTSTPTKPSGVS